jgi:Cu+-exporting ATPase
MTGGSTETSIDPVCGMTVAHARAAGHVEHDGHTYYFCGLGCMRKFEADPAKFVKPSQQPDETPEPGASSIDPVCGMTVPHTRAAGHVDHGAHTYYFCSLGCMRKFQADPARYLDPAPSVTATDSANVEYTCPMHPEVTQIGPGSCPICGMALEPRIVSMDEGPNPELIDMTRRLWISAALTLPLVVGAMAGFMPQWLQLALASPVVLWGGWPFFVRGGPLSSAGISTCSRSLPWVCPSRTPTA